MSEMAPTQPCRTVSLPDVSSPAEPPINVRRREDLAPRILDSGGGDLSLIWMVSGSRRRRQRIWGWIWGSLQYLQRAILLPTRSATCSVQNVGLRIRQAQPRAIADMTFRPVRS